MHGMICKSFEGYVVSTHGEAAWLAACRTAGFRAARFEPLEQYDDALFERLLDAVSDGLRVPRSGLLEDVGFWLCTHPPLESVRRLLRFCGTTYRSFLFSLEEVEARARLALPGLALPAIQLEESGEPGRFAIRSRWTVPGAGDMIAGILHAMASDHGALAVIETAPARKDGAAWCQEVSIHLVREGFHAPRAFALVPGAA